MPPPATRHLMMPGLLPLPITRPPADSHADIPPERLYASMPFSRRIRVAPRERAPVRHVTITGLPLGMRLAA